VPLLTALRRLLGTFRLPGEAQKIDRTRGATREIPPPLCVAAERFESLLKKGSPGQSHNIRSPMGPPITPARWAPGPVVQAFADHWFGSNRDSDFVDGVAPLNPFTPPGRSLSPSQLH